TLLIKVAAECAAGKRDKLFIFGDDYDTKDGTCIRDFIHVDDISSAHLAALDYLQENESNVFNVGYGHGFSVKEVIEAMKKVSGVDFKVELAPRRAGDPSVLISDASKIRNLTSWQPKYDDLEL
ncbi:GDP-mannose 4,6-dehydratase, partial [Campylobacter jejuni]